MNVGSLFSGIGGLELGLERAGMRTVWQVECEPYARAVLAKHWPDVPRFDDVRSVGAGNLPPVDLICGGFPCQDISDAGRRAGIRGGRSGLWSEMARIVGELRPSWVVIENVGALVGRGLAVVLGDLAALGFDAEWTCLRASDVGAPHRRERLFIVAHPSGEGFQGSHGPGSSWEERWGRALRQTQAVARRFWETEPKVGRVADGVPRRVDRTRCLGNAVVPQVAEVLGRLIQEAHESPQHSI